MPRSHRLRPAPRGTSLLEVTIAMSILLVGLLGMMHFQIAGITGNNGGRMQGIATELAQEVMEGVERLPFGDPLLAPTGTTGPTQPVPFGSLLDGSGGILPGAHEWADATPIPGVRLAGEVPAEFERRWSVWGYSPGSGGSATVKVIAVSVVYREPALRFPREVVRYTQIFEPRALIVNVAANQ
ncbi:MAG TPA: hypothetical protein VLS93_09675 [Anaeromyxobacteraceae bacterium]|nr:hypothetical protein [Anaeromyxobacteraceae bacterium]